MSVRFDDDARSLRLSVADLLEREQRGSLGFSNRGGFERMWLGQAIHSAYQNRALAEDDTYRSEVWLDLELTFKGWEVRLNGRADGLRRDEADGLIVEEIKSVRRSGVLAPALREAYERQAAIYVWMLEQTENEPVLAELVLIEIGSSQIERFRLEATSHNVEVAVHRRLGGLIADREKRRRSRQERHTAAARLDFPYAEKRLGQEDIIARVDQALHDAEHLFVEAPTGLGKTAAVLYPVLRFAQLHDKRVFLLTAKNLQQEMAGKVLELLNPEAAFSSLQLRAKARMCANHELLCHEEYCGYARDYFLKLHSSGVVQRLVAEHPDLRPDVVFDAASGCEICPFEVSLELVREVQAIVCDYNYVFDPYVALNEFGAANDLSDIILVIDEAHNLVDRGRGYYSPELSRQLVLDVLGEWRLQVGDLAAQIRDLAGQLAKLISDEEEEWLPAGERDEGAEIQLPEDDLWALRPALDQAFVAYLEHRRETRSFSTEEPFVTLYFAFVRFLNAAAAADSSFTVLVKRSAGDASLKILCSDASRFLGAVINRAHATIALSATLSPEEFYRELLGFDPERASTLSVPGPFPRENRRIVIDTSVATTWRQREQNYPRIAERLADFVREVPGNCMALFPSYGFLERVAQILPGVGHDVIVQKRSDSTEQREAILDQLKSSLFGRVLLLSVAGGVFAEGVDYPGEMLKAVVIISPCLPAVSLEQRLLQRHYDERFGRGFEYAYVIPGVTRVVQAAGRLIRSDLDRGVIALMDQRFLQQPYLRHLPAEWIPEEGPQGLVGEPAAIARSFFASESSSSEEKG